MSVHNVSQSREYLGLSTDTKPTQGLTNGDRFREVDTLVIYRWIDGEWLATPRLRRERYARSVVTIGDSITGQASYRVTASSITAAAGVATCTTGSSHQLFPGSLVMIGDCAEEEYNGLKAVIERTSSTVFTYAIDTGAPADATGANITVLNVHRFQDRGTFHLANMTLGYPFRELHNAGISGQTIVECAARFNRDALAYNPSMIVIQGGVNDITGTTAGQEAASLVTIKAAFVEMIEKCIAAGIVPLVYTCFPLSAAGTGYTAARAQMIVKLNTWLREIARYEYPEMVLFDAYAAAVNPTNTDGDYNTNFSTDGTHLTALGAQRVAASLATLLTPFRYTPAKLVSSVLDTYDTDSSNPQLFPNPLMTGTGGTKSTAGAGSGTNTGNVPDGLTVLWTRAGTGTVVNSIASRSDGIGSDLQAVVTAQNASDSIQIDLSSSIHARVTAGDVLVTEVHLVMTSITALSALQFGFIFTLDSVVYTAPLAISSSAVGELDDDIDMVLQTEPFTMPAGSLTTFEPRLTATFSGAGGATIKVGRWSVRKAQADA